MPWPDERRILMRFADWIRAERELLYPSMVDRGEMTAEAAERGLRIAGAIAADWHFACTFEPRPDDAPQATPREKLHELRMANGWERSTVARAQAIDILIAEYEKPFDFVWCAETTIALRALYADPSRRNAPAPVAAPAVVATPTPRPATSQPQQTRLL